MEKPHFIVSACPHPFRHAAKRPSINHGIDKLLHNNQDLVESQLRLLHADGQVRDVLSRAVVLRHDGRTPHRIVGLDTDVTQVRRV